MATPTNPNPARITDELWWFWVQIDLLITGVKLGGIYANKKGYHNTVNANKVNWPKDYSIRVPLDLKGLFDKARAIDLTMSDANMVLYTGRLVAAVKANDPRLFGIREFIGTTDTNNVVCYIKDDEDGPWRFDGGRDSSHLWHIHISIFTYYVNNMLAMSGLLSVMAGESLESWLKDGTDLMFCTYGDKQSDKVRGLQALLINMGFDPGGVDGSYGDRTAAALRAALKDPTNDGKNYGHWEYAAVFRIMAQQHAGKDGEDGSDGAGLQAGDAIQLGAVRLELSDAEQKLAGVVVAVHHPQQRPEG